MSTEAVPMVRNDFLSMLSHDLLGPIGNVIGFADLLARELERGGQDARRLLRRLQANAQHLQTVLEGTLAVSQSAERPVRPEPVNLAQAVLGASERNAFLAGQKDIAIFVEAGDLTITTDRVRLGRILDNLVSNAVKVAPRGTRVTLGAAREGDRVRLSVADQGPGLPGGAVHGQLVNLLPTSIRGRATPGGHGLGLEIVKRLARQLGGSAGVTSRPGEGATFWVILPADRAVAA